MKRALITGVSGQDGAYLCRLLLEKGYEAHGTSRDADYAGFHNLKRLDVFGKVKLHSMSPVDFRSTLQLLGEVQPDEIYCLSGQSSVGLSFGQPVETMESIVTGTLTILEVIRFLGRPVRAYFASSGECFGDTGGVPAAETTAFRPRSPYGVAKAAAFWQVANYREAYNLEVCSGILFNHESPLRPERFVTRKIVAAACRISGGSNERLVLGDLGIRRDWGWAPEYVDAMWRMLQVDNLQDLVIATGEHYSLEDFVDLVFTEVGLNWRDHVETSDLFHRPSDIAIGVGNAEKAEQLLGWKAEKSLPQIIRELVVEEKKYLTIKRGWNE